MYISVKFGKTELSRLCKFSICYSKIIDKNRENYTVSQK